jgi:hypothetical protein
MERFAELPRDNTNHMEDDETSSIARNSGSRVQHRAMECRVA